MDSAKGEFSANPQNAEENKNSDSSSDVHEDARSMPPGGDSEEHEDARSMPPGSESEEHEDAQSEKKVVKQRDLALQDCRSVLVDLNKNILLFKESASSAADLYKRLIKLMELSTRDYDSLSKAEQDYVAKESACHSTNPLGKQVEILGATIQSTSKAIKTNNSQLEEKLYALGSISLSTGNENTKNNMLGIYRTITELYRSISSLLEVKSARDEVEVEGDKLQFLTERSEILKKLQQMTKMNNAVNESLITHPKGVEKNIQDMNSHLDLLKDQMDEEEEIVIKSDELERRETSLERRGDALERREYAFKAMYGSRSKDSPIFIIQVSCFVLSLMCTVSATIVSILGVAMKNTNLFKAVIPIAALSIIIGFIGVLLSTNSRKNCISENVPSISKRDIPGIPNEIVRDISNNDISNKDNVTAISKSNGKKRLSKSALATKARIAYKYWLPFSLVMLAVISCAIAGIIKNNSKFHIAGISALLIVVIGIIFAVGHLLYSIWRAHESSHAAEDHAEVEQNIQDYKPSVVISDSEATALTAKRDALGSELAQEAELLVVLKELFRKLEENSGESLSEMMSPLMKLSDNIAPRVEGTKSILAELMCNIQNLHKLVQANESKDISQLPEYINIIDYLKDSSELLDGCMQLSSKEKISLIVFIRELHITESQIDSLKKVIQTNKSIDTMFSELQSIMSKKTFPESASSKLRQKIEQILECRFMPLPSDGEYEIVNKKYLEPQIKAIVPEYNATDALNGSAQSSHMQKNLLAILGGNFCVGDVDFLEAIIYDSSTPLSQRVQLIHLFRFTIKIPVTLNKDDVEKMLYTLSTTSISLEYKKLLEDEFKNVVDNDVWIEDVVSWLKELIKEDKISADDGEELINTMNSIVLSRSIPAHPLPSDVVEEPDISR